jgi:hypothetical protein
VSTEIELHRPAALSLPEKMEYARALAVASLLPKQYQQNPGNLLFAMEYAEALNIAPIHAITSIHVIEGKPSASADLIAATIRRAGHKLRITGDDTNAVAQLIRADDPDFTYEARWDMDKARTAGLTGKAVWKNYPAAMLRSRAITEVARMGATDALFGVIYTPEELGAEVDAQGVPVITSASPQPTPTRVTAAEITGAPAAKPVEAGEQPPPDEPGITKAQLTKLHTVLTKVGCTDREQGLAYYERVIGRRVESSKDLTKAEAIRIIDSLENTDGADVQTGEVVNAELLPDGGYEPDPDDLAAMEAEMS